MAAALKPLQPVPSVAVAHVRRAILPSLAFYSSVVLIAHVSLEQRDRWYPADLRDNLIQNTERVSMQYRDTRDLILNK